MKRLMLGTFPLMDETAGPTGEAGGGAAGGEESGGGEADGGEAKPYLGEPKPEAPKAPEAPEAPKAPESPENPETPAPPTDEDYAKALVKDETLLGDDSRVQLDAELFKACIPTARKYGVSPEAANALANALARAQVDDAKQRMKSRTEYFEKMKQESLRTYTPADFETINAGIDKWFKPGGTMNMVIRNSELGADPEFLALMHFLGKSAAQDTGAGAAGGAASPSGDGDGIDGISGLWK